MKPDLNQALTAIGIRLGGVDSPSRCGRDNFDIEQVLLDAAGQAREDGRLLSLLFSWVHVHAEHVLVEKLGKRLRGMGEDERLVISALGAYALDQGQHKWRKLIHAPKASKYLSGSTNAESAVKLKGAESWLSEHNILVACGSIRIRPEDVLTVEALAKENLQYRNRLLYGASWRADIITAIQQGAPTPTAIMKRIGCSYEPAHRVRREYLIATGA